ncbi:MAG: hypothetical protein SynsKO_16120 [Synoicihabitans sp.]
MLLTFLCLHTAIASMGREGGIIPEEAFWEAGFPWLAVEPSENPEPFEIPVYQLSCSSCLDSFAAILSGEEEPSTLFFLNTSKPEDREVARTLIATVLVQTSDSARRAKFRELLDAYLAAPEIYLNDLLTWRQLCLDLRGDVEKAVENPQPWADALNQLQAQNRLLGWLDVYQTPTWLSMDEDSRRVLAEEDLDEYQRQFRMLMLTEPSLQPVLADKPVKVHQIQFDSGRALNAESWSELADQIEEGALWMWRETRANRSKWVQAWRTELESLPTLDARRSFFITTFRTAAEWKKRGKWSLTDFLKNRG